MEAQIQFVCVACRQTNIIAKSELLKHLHELTEATRAEHESFRVYIVRCAFCGEHNRLRVKL